MWHRLVAVAGLVLVSAALAPAQPNSVYSKAVPPGKAALERLNLRTEWTVVIPVEGTRDTITQVQTFDDQVFVQTRAGVLVALDALTGRVQWYARLGSGSYGNSYPVAVNSQFVFCTHITKLYAFYRYTGVTEFVTDLGTPPTAGLAADEEAVYCVLGVRPGSAGAHRIAVYELPTPITVNDPNKGRADALAQGAKGSAPSPFTEVLNRYAAGAAVAPARDIPEITPRPRVMEAPVSGYTGSKTPSLAALPTIVPPYVLGNRAPAPSLNTVPSLRQPYHLRLESGKYIQSTPSLGVIPPSIAASLQLADLRPKSVSPPLRWEYGLTSRLLYPLVLTPTRVWAVTDDNTVIAFNKDLYKGSVSVEVREQLSSPVAAPPVAAGTTQYVPMGNGNLIAVEGTTGGVTGGADVKWRADGGLNNRSPFVSKGRVYAAGDNSGVACINRETGEILWRSDKGADRVIAANEEFVYIRDRQGRFLVYDASRPTDAARKRSVPLGSADFSEFDVPIVNTASDRIYLGADNGLIVCLRDANAKYAKPMSLWPAPTVNRQRAAAVDTKGGAGREPKTDLDPKKDADPKN